METVRDFIWGSSKITADGYYSHEIKRCLLPGRKAMTHLGSILKSRDIILPTKVCPVKTMVFPVVMYGCESWTIKKAEHWRIDAFELWCWRRVLRIPWAARRSNQSILKEISPEYSLEALMLKLKLQYFGHLMQRADSLEKTLMLGKTEGRSRRGQQRMRWLDHLLSRQEFEQVPGDGEGQGGLVCCSPWGHKVGIQLSDWTRTTRCAVDKNLPTNAEDTCSSPGLGSLHASEQLLVPQLLNPSAVTAEAHAHVTCVLWQEKPPQWEACTLHQRVAPTCCD